MKNFSLLILTYLFSNFSNAQYIYCRLNNDNVYFIHCKQDTAFLFSWEDNLRSSRINTSSFFIEDTLLNDNKDLYISDEFNFKKYSETKFVLAKKGKRKIKMDKKNLLKGYVTNSIKEAYLQFKLNELNTISPYFAYDIPDNFNDEVQEVYNDSISLVEFKPICEKYVAQKKQELTLIHTPLTEKLNNICDSLSQFTFSEFESRFIPFFIDEKLEMYSHAILDSVAKNKPDFFFELFRFDKKRKKQLFNIYNKPSSKVIRKNLHQVNGYKKEKRYFFWKRRGQVTLNSLILTGVVALEASVITGTVYLLSLL